MWRVLGDYKHQHTIWGVQWVQVHVHVAFSPMNLNLAYYSTTAVQLLIQKKKKQVFYTRFDTCNTFSSSFNFTLNILSFFLFHFRGCYWSRVQGLSLRTQDSDPPWPAQEHHQSPGSLHARKATDGYHGICPSWQLAVISSNKEGHLRTRLDQDNEWSRQRVYISWSGDDRLSGQPRHGIPGIKEGK